MKYILILCLIIGFCACRSSKKVVTVAVPVSLQLKGDTAYKVISDSSLHNLSIGESFSFSNDFASPFPANNCISKSKKSNASKAITRKQKASGSITKTAKNHYLFKAISEPVFIHDTIQAAVTCPECKPCTRTHISKYWYVLVGLLLLLLILIFISKLTNKPL